MKIGKLGFRVGTNSWYTRVDGKQVSLVKGRENKADAELEYSKLVLKAAAVNGGPANDYTHKSVEQLATFYQGSHLSTLPSATQERKQTYLKPFVQTFGKMDCADVKGYMIEDWVKSMSTWNNNTRAAACKTLSALYNWAMRREMLSKSPMLQVVRPVESARGEDMVISGQTYKALCEHAKDYMRDILTALWQTGSRPSEILGAHVSELSADGTELLKKKHKTAHKGQKRIITLPPAIAAIAARNAVENPKGYLFPRADGGMLNADDFRYRLQTLSKRAGVKEKVVPYCFRHSAATRWLLAGIPESVVARLLGHKGTRTLTKHYDHTLGKVRDLARWASKIEEALAV